MEPLMNLSDYVRKILLEYPTITNMRTNSLLSDCVKRLICSNFTILQLKD